MVGSLEQMRLTRLPATKSLLGRGFKMLQGRIEKNHADQGSKVEPA